MPRIEATIPAGVGKAHDRRSDEAREWFTAHHPRAWRRTPFSPKQEEKTVSQFGTLGSGNHHVTLCLDERSVVWAELHSGSRGIGNQLATAHIEHARRGSQRSGLHLEDRDLSYFTEGTVEFDDYVADMLWAQDYALANREQMMDVLLAELFALVGHGTEVRRVNCHHNYAIRERHEDRELWITRKGAIRARRGDQGVIPGSMGNDVLIVRGKGEPSSYQSSAHGAGRRHSRTQAKKRFTVDELCEQMTGVTWNRDRARLLVDEIPGAYKDLGHVMEDQADLVEVERSLHEVFNYKGS